LTRGAPAFQTFPQQSLLILVDSALTDVFAISQSLTLTHGGKKKEGLSWTD
jgi:hypothetical protein